MLREKGFVPACGRRRVLEVGPEREHIDARLVCFAGIGVASEHHGFGGEAARAAHPDRAQAGVGFVHFRDANDRVVAAHENVAVVHEKAVGDLAEPRKRFVISGDKRLTAGVCTRHDEEQVDRLMLEPGRAGGAPEVFVKEEGVKRRIREHHADFDESVGDAAEGALGKIQALSRKDDRLRGRKEEPLFFVIQLNDGLRRGDVGRHDRQRLFIAVLAGAQSGDRLRAARVADEMKAPDSLHRDDFARKDRSQGVFNGVARNRTAGSVSENEFRSAYGTGIGLRVEAPIERIFVFAQTVGAHRKPCHRGLRTVVGERMRDREARSAVRAVCEGVAPAPPLGVEHIGKTCIARCRIRRNGGRHVPARARSRDGEVFKPLAFGRVHFDRIDAREGRLFV